MSRNNHRIFIFLMSSIVLYVLIYMFLKGISFYNTPVEERFFHDDYDSLKPSGAIGHGLGIIGTLLIIFGVLIYMTRKRANFMRNWGLLKYWLEFHIFLCTLGPVMVLYHTSFKFGGLVSISFWSMVAVFVSGVTGRFIYLQIPRSREGRALSLGEVISLKTDLNKVLEDFSEIDENTKKQILSQTNPTIVIEGKGSGFGRSNYRASLASIKSLLEKNNLSGGKLKELTQLIRMEYSLNKKIERLNKMQNLFKYWHIAHLPFALVMLIIMLIHVIITVSLGYKWIF